MKNSLTFLLVLGLTLLGISPTFAQRGKAKQNASFSRAATAASCFSTNLTATQKVCSGAGLTLLVVPTTQDPTDTYEWYRNGVIVANIVGNAGANYSVPAADLALATSGTITYSVLYHGTCTTSAGEMSATTTIMVDPMITVMTAANNAFSTIQNICLGSSVTLNAVGVFLNYDVNSVTWGNTTDAAGIVAPNPTPGSPLTQTFTPIVGNVTKNYNVTVHGVGSCNIYQRAAFTSVKIDAPLAITAGTMTAPAAFCGPPPAGQSVTAPTLTATSGTPTTVKWYLNNTLQAQNTLASFPVPATAVNGDSVKVVLTNACGSVSAGVKLAISTTVPAPPATRDTVICAGSSIKFKSYASDPKYNAQYTWNGGGPGTSGFTYNNTNNIGWTPGLGTVTYTDATPNTNTTITNYIVQDDPTGLTCGGGGWEQWNVKVVPQPTARLLTSPVCEGQKQHYTVFTGVTEANFLAAGLTIPTYTWYKSGTSTPIAGATSSTFDSPATTLAQTGVDMYYCVVTYPSCPGNSAQTQAIAISAFAKPKLMLTDQKVCVGQPMTFTVTGISDVNLTTLVWTDPQGNTNNGLSTYAATTAATTNDDGTYSVTANGYLGCNSVTVTAYAQGNVAIPVTAAAIAATSANLCEGATATLTGTLTPATGATSYVVKWYKATAAAPTTWTLIAGATSTTYSPVVSATDDGSIYKMVVTNACGGADVISNTQTIKVDKKPSFVLKSLSSMVCPGAADSILVSATNSAPLTWTFSPTGVTTPNSYVALPAGAVATAGGTAPNATSRVDIAAPAGVVTANAGYYKVKATSLRGYCTAVVDSAKISMKATATLTTTPAPVDQSVCEGKTATFSVAVTGPTATFQWFQISANNKDTTAIVGATSTTLSVATTLALNGTHYLLKTTGDCGTIPGIRTANLLVGPKIVLAAAAVDTTINVCSGVALTKDFTGTTATALTTSGYVWTFTDAVSGVTATYAGVPAASQNVIPFNTIVPTSAQSGTYKVYAKGTGSCATDSVLTGTFRLNVIGRLTAAAAVTTTPAICSGATFTASVTTTGTATGYQWYKKVTDPTTLVATNTMISGATSSTYSISNASSGDGADYYCVAYNTCKDTVTSNTVNLVINTSAAPNLVNNSGAHSVCSGSTITLSASGCSDGAHTQWQGGNSGGTGLTLSVSAAGNYIAKCLDPTTGCLSSPSNNEVIVSGAASYSTSTSDVSCAGKSDGSMTVNTSGTVTWDNGSTSATLGGLGASTHTFTVSSGGCSGSGSLTVNAPSTTPTLTVTPASSGCTGGTVSIAATGANGALTYSLDNGAAVSLGSATTISNVASGSHTISVSDSKGCAIGTKTFTVTAASAGGTPRTITSIPDTMKVCPTKSFTATAKETWAKGYYWITPAKDTVKSATITGTALGTYTVYVADSSGCNGASKKMVVVNSGSSTMSVTGASTAVVGTAITLTDATSPKPTSVTWTAGTGLTTVSSSSAAITVNATTAGTYKVSAVADVAGCSYTYSKDIVYTAMTFGTNQDYTILGNPYSTSGTMNLQLPTDHCGSFKVTVYTSFGRKVLEKSYSNYATTSVSIVDGALAPGMYIVYYTCDNMTTGTSKVVVFKN